MRPLLLILSLASCAAPPPRSGPELRISWEKNYLTIHAPEVPGGQFRVLYLEAYCRSGSTDREWRLTTIPHKTEMLPGSDDRTIRLRCRVDGGVEVEHTIVASKGEVSFDVSAVNRGAEYVDAVWVQPCIQRLGAFTGAGQKTYPAKSFIFIEGKQTFLDQARRTEEAIYKGGQVYVPAGIDRKDANPRPHSPDVPSNGLIGCVSHDGKWLMATAWEPYQELFQGVIVCLHSDFRLGGLKPGEAKRARGRIYVMENDVDALLRRYGADFPAR
jgi:hypothetical protein